MSLNDESDNFLNNAMMNPPISMFISERHIQIEPQLFSHITPAEISYSFPDSCLKVEKYTGEKSTCPLCLDDIEHNSDIYKLICNHVFHAHKCMQDKNIIDWIAEHQTCPYCRAKTSVSIIDEDAIFAIMMTQANVSREAAIIALRNHDNIVNAILSFD